LLQESFAVTKVDKYSLLAFGPTSKLEN